METVTQWNSEDEKSLIVKWDRISNADAGFAKIEMVCSNLPDKAAIAAKLGLWEAIASSVRRLDAPPAPAEAAALK